MKTLRVKSAKEVRTLLNDSRIKVQSVNGLVFPEASSKHVTGYDVEAQETRVLSYPFTVQFTTL